MKPNLGFYIFAGVLLGTFYIFFQVMNRTKKRKRNSRKNQVDGKPLHDTANMLEGKVGGVQQKCVNHHPMEVDDFLGKPNMM